MLYSVMHPYMSDIFMVLIVLGSAACLSPLYNLPNTETFDQFDDESYLSIRTIILTSQFYRQSLTAGAYIVLIPTADLCIELFQRGFDLLTSEKSEDRVVSTVTRLTNCERFLFICGVFLRSVAILVPINDSFRQIAFDCTNNSATILLTCPILVFLSRCTTTWTPLVTLPVILLAVIANIIEVSTFYYKPGTPIRANLLLVSNIMVLAAILIVFILTFICLYKYITSKIGHICLRSYFSSKEQKLENTTMTTTSNAASTKNVAEKRVVDDLYENYVPAIHMSVGILVSMAYFFGIVARQVNPSNTADIQSYINVWILVCVIVVLIVEYRIRGNEITRGLIREKVTLSLLLDSKKSYVRYISHELRTPLNTTFLGMRLLIKEFKRSDDPRDLGYFETLNDMSLSCNAALDILNDLLCFEKLESGILDLHKQDVLIVPFIQECVNMFAVQAKESGVTVNILSLSANLDDDEFKFQESFESPADKFNKHDFLAVGESDVIKIDRFKMDQVIRNLISNALKFTPRNGLITVKIGFAIDRYDPDSSSSAPTNSLRIQSSDDGSQTRSLFSHANSMYNLPRPQLMSRWGSKIKSSKVLVGSVAEGSETIDVEAQMSGQLPGIQDTLCISRKKDTQPPIEKGKLVIVVTDSGAGISESNQKRLFKEIIQFSPEILQAGGGSGLGLWITRGIVDLHEGKISVYSAGEGEGSSFTLVLPMQRIAPLRDIRAQASFEDMSSCMSAEEGIALYRSTSFDTTQQTTINWSDTLTVNPVETLKNTELRVLVVDDSRLNRKMLIKCLTLDGHVCDEAEDGLEAVAKIKHIMSQGNKHGQRAYDAVLMDFIMPNMNGPTATEEIRSLGYTAPIFGVTGNGLTTDIEYFKNSGVDTVLLKPLSIVSFYDAMTQFSGTKIS